MGCSNARLLVQAPLTGEAGAGTTSPLSSPSTVATSPVNVATDTNNSSTRMHLTGVDLVVERNGSYTLLLTPKTHKQLMPYVLRKKRFRILVDKPRSDPTLTSNEPIVMENNKDSKETSKKSKKIESTVESLEQVALDEYEKARDRFVGGRSIDRGNPEDEDENVQSDDEGMIEEIVTTVEHDKDLERKVKKKIETKRTTAQHPETHNTITKVVKTEVTEITHTITINDRHDLERAKRELGIDYVNRLLPSSSWIDQTRLTQKRYEPTNEIITSKDFPSDTPIKKSHPDEKPILAESTTVGRGPVTETMPSIESKSIEIKKKKKKKSKLCSCTRAVDDDEQDKQKAIITPTEQPPAPSSKKSSLVASPIIKSVISTQSQGQQLISSDLKQLIIDKKFLLIEYIHSKIFAPANLFSSSEEDAKAKKISSRILDLLRYDRCLSWKQMSEQLTEEYVGNSIAQQFLQPMINTYEHLFTTKQANLSNTFATIHNANDLTNIQENNAYLNIVQTQIVDVSTKQSAPNEIEQLPEEQVQSLPELTEEIQVEKVINTDDEQPIKELNMPNDIEEPQPAYNEEYLIKMLADVSQHKPITLAEAIAYQYLDIEDPKLGLSTEAIQRIKSLFRPLTDQTLSNVIRVKRAGEYLTDVNLSDTNPFDKLTETEPLIYQLQQTFEPTLDFNEKQFRSLTEIILNNKEQYDQLEFDIARTSLPVYDLKESSTNDFSQSDSGYSMTTATHESLASKIKIEFEPINQELGPIPPKRDDLYEDERIDLDKSAQEQLEKFELNQDLIQIIKSDFNGTDKTIGQAILSRELRLDSTDPSDISYLKSLGIDKEEIRILTAFFFPKHTRIIAYSPEPGRFVEAQTTFNPDYPGYKTDTTIIQIQEKQLSSDQLAMQRNIHEDRTVVEPELPTPMVVQSTSTKPKTPPPTPVPVKKRKSTASGGLLSCFKSKKPKSGTEQQGQPITAVSQQTTTIEERPKLIEEKPTIDYSILPDGKRIYIDAFRDRPGLDMSYKPDDFENRFVLPIGKPASEYERPITPEIQPRKVQAETAVPVQSEVVEAELVAQPPPSIIEHKVHVHLEPRPATIEPVDVQPESSPVVVPLTRKSEEKIVTKKSLPLDLHGAPVHLPEIELVTPGPLPTLSLTKEKKTLKVKKSTAGLCASCFGAKSAAKKKKEVVLESVQAPIEPRKSVEKEEKKDLSPITEVPSTPTTDKPILPRVNIDIFRERTFEKGATNLPPKSQNQSVVQASPVVESSLSSPTTESVPQIAKDTSIFSRVNIDTFRERTFQKSSESLPKSQERLDTVHETVTPPAETLYQSPKNEPISPPISASPTVQPTTKDTSIFSQVNIDTFRDRTFQKSSESLPKSQERLDTVTPPPSAEPLYQLPRNESIPSPVQTTPSVQSTTKDTSIFSQVNIDTFRDRTFQKSSESLPKSQERLDTVTPPPSAEPLHQLPTNESIPSPVQTTPSVQSTTKDTSIFSQVNIDTFKDRTFEKSSETLPRTKALLISTNETVTSPPPPPYEEPHYQLPTNEPVTPPFPTSRSIEQITKDSSIFSQVNIDTFKERTFEKSSQSLPKSEEPHYELPSSEPVSIPFENGYSNTESNTYDIPRPTDVEQTSSSIETKTEEKIINREIMSPPTTIDIQKSSGDFLSTTPIEQASKTEELSSIKTEIMPDVPIKESKIKKGSLTLPIKKKKTREPKIKSEKKPNVFSTLFRHSERKSKVPALDLPAVEHDLSTNNSLRPPHRRDSDPLHVPLVDLPKLDLPLPAYDQPEVDMTTGSIKQSSEFSIPVVNFPPIPDLQLPENTKQSIQINSDHMKAPHVQLPDLQSTLTNQERVKLPDIPLKIKSEKVKQEESLVPSITKTSLALSSPLQTDYTIKTEQTITQISSSTSDQQVTIIDTHLVQSSEVPVSVVKQTISSDLGFQLPSPEPVVIVSKDFKTSPPSFDDDVPSPPTKIVPAVKISEKQPKEIKQKSSTLALCSCFGQKSTISKNKTSTITAPKASLPEIEMPVPSSNISSTLKTKGPLRAPSNNLPPVDLTLPSTETVRLPTIHVQETKSHEIEAVVPSSPEETIIKSEILPSTVEKQSIEEVKTVSTEPKKSSSFEIKAPVLTIPPLDLSGPLKSEAYLSFSKQESIQSRSDSGLEAVISSHVHPSSTFGTHTTLDDIPQLPSVSSGFGSEILDNMTTKGYSLPDIQLPEPTLVPKRETSSTKHDFTRQITLTEETRAKLIFRQNELKTRLETEISKSVEDFDAKKDQKSLDKILTHAIDLIKEKKATTYPELKHKLIIEHKNEAYLVDPIVHSLYYTMENHGLDNLDKPEFPLAIRDMVRLPAKQTYDTVTHLNKESASLGTTSMTKETAGSCLTCGRSKSKTTTTTTSISSSTGVLDERRRLQLNTYRTELGTILRDHIQSSQPSIREFPEHSKEIEKIVRKGLTLVTQPKIVSYEQIRNELKLEYKQTYYLIDPIVDIIRDTFDHCDMTQMHEKTNLNILDSNISQTANLYNHQSHLLTPEEQNAFKSNQLSWLQSYLINNESKEKKITRKQTKELNKIFHRTLEILSTNLITTWDELALQLQREYPKAHDLCNRSIELIRQSQKDGLFHLQQAPNQDKRRVSSLLTDHARQNLKTNRAQIILSLKNFLIKHNQELNNDEKQLDNYLNKTFQYLEEQKAGGPLKSYQDLKEQLKKDFKKTNQENFIEQIVDIIEQAHATNQFDDIDKPEVQILMKDRFDGKPLVIKEMYVSLPPRVGAYGDDSIHYSSNGDRTTTSHRVARGLSWREANERARILFYRGKHPAIHYDEQAAAFDVRMLLETASGGTQEIPVTDSDVQELLNSCGVQWDGVNIISLVDHSEDVVRAAEQAALKVIREKGIVGVRPPPPPSTNNDEIINSS